MGWCDAEGEVKLYTDNPSVTAAPCHFSLRLGHGAALTCHRHVIHYRAAAALPLKLPRCSLIRALLHMFFDRLSIPIR